MARFSYCGFFAFFFSAAFFERAFPEAIPAFFARARRCASVKFSAAARPPRLALSFRYSSNSVTDPHVFLPTPESVVASDGAIHGV